MQVRGRERITDLSIGYASVALFGVSIAVLVWFLLSGVSRAAGPGESARRFFEDATAGRGDARAMWNVLLMLAWGFLHSLLARPRFKTHMQKYVRPHLEPAVYALVSSGGLIVLCWLYRPIPREVYALAGGPALLVRILFWAAWALFLYCWLHLDLLEVVGLRPILRYLDGEARRHEPFRPTGPFLWVRHPVELSFLLAFWAAPRMTAGHLLFASVMTAYTFLGIDLEERKMLELDGPGYAQYMKRVPQIFPLPR